MAKFYVDFSGYCEIEATSALEAKNKFWELISNDYPLPKNIYEIDSIEEKSEERG